MQVHPIKTRIFVEGEDISAFIYEHIPALKDGAIVVVASKIVALAEKRVVVLGTREDKEALIRQESEWMKHIFGPWWLTVRDGTVVVNAGIDESNVDPVKSLRDHGASRKLILLPKDSFASAESLRSSILHPPERTGSVRAGKARMKNLGIIITDSRITPLRRGVVGVALGYAGFRGIRDYRGAPDLFGRAMEVTETDIADSLATAATLVMGEGSESQPLAVIEGAPVEWALQVDREEMKMPRDQDMFKHLFD